MIARVIEWCCHNKLVVLLATVAALAGAFVAFQRIPLDALPDLSDTQVIVYSRWDRSPNIVEDQVTYPIISALLGAPKVKSVRGFSDYGFSYVYVIFEDGVDLYWARSRVLEYLSKILPQMPAGVETELGPDATSVGWVYQYALVDRSQKLSLADLRSLQDWNLRYQLQSVPGVSEVASVGGFQKQYQVQLDPQALAAYRISLMDVVRTVQQSNQETSARMLDISGAEFMVRSLGYIQNEEDLLRTAVGKDNLGNPILLRQVARVALGPEMRRGTADYNGSGDSVGAIVLMRHGENARNVIGRVKNKIAELKNSLPPGVEIVPTYDRSDLIDKAMQTLRHTLTEELIVVSLVILLFLWHIPSAIVPIVTIPVSTLLAFLPLYFFGIGSNLMSLAGIAISIGVLVDGAIVEVENAYKKLELWQAGGRKGDFHEVRIEALKEVGPSVFFSLLVIAVAFLPVFTLVDQEGRLFKPLAWSKNLTMFLAAILAVTLDPALRMFFTRMDPVHFKPQWLSRAWNAVTVGTYYPESRHPISRRLHQIYNPVCRAVLKKPKWIIGGSLALVLATIPIYLQLGSEFMPPLYEGSLLYMPTTLPGISISESQNLLTRMDQILAEFPEIQSIYGKAGRAETATDPAPLSMFETTLLLKDPAEWRKKERWYSPLPEFLQKLFRPFASDRISKAELIRKLDGALQFPGVVNAWTMPIKARIDMLSTGIKTPVGVKVLGGDLAAIAKTAEAVEEILRNVPGTRSVFAERAQGGYFLDVQLRREELGRYGLSLAEAQSLALSAIGGENVTTALHGRERWSVNVRYSREFRDSLEKLARVLITTPQGAQIHLSQIADIQMTLGPSMLRNENGLLAGYVYVDVTNSDIGGYVQRAKAEVAQRLKIPAGTTLVWSGQYENMLRVKERLKWVVPLTLGLIFFLLYLNTGSGFKTALVMTAVPFSLIGAVWLLWALDYNLSIAVWVGMIALMGLDAETGVFMLLFLDLSFEEAQKAGRLRSASDLREAVRHGAVERLRPKLMTVATGFLGLVPVLYSAGIGADLLKRIAAPMVGGLFSSFILELLVYPPAYYLWKQHHLKLPE